MKGALGVLALVGVGLQALSLGQTFSALVNAF